jgi:hypothetical protein
MEIQPSTSPKHDLNRSFPQFSSAFLEREREREREMLLLPQIPFFNLPDLLQSVSVVLFNFSPKKNQTTRRRKNTEEAR